MQRETTTNKLTKIVEAIWQQQLESYDNGDLLPAEFFFERHAELHTSPEFAIDVIFNEYELLKRNGEPGSVDPHAFIKRFPKFGIQLAKQFEVVDALDSFDLKEFESAETNASANHGQQPDAFNFSRFRDRKIIGQGGTATIEMAFDEKLNQHVALKRLHTHLRNSQRAVERLRREAQTVARLHHPNIVPIYEILDEAGDLVLISRYVDGTNLRDLTESQGIASTERLVNWVRQIAEALHYAHENDVTHRDIKPSNIMIDVDDNAMLTDFGLASFSQSSGAITQTGDLVGTPAFMSPEQAQGEPDSVDHRTDIYSLGATLYFLLCGRAPFVGSFTNVVQQVVARPVRSPQAHGAAMPSDLETITLKCLSKLPADRYLTARELSDDLRRFQDGEVIKAKQAGPLERLAKFTRRRPVLSSLITATALLSAFLLGALLQLGAVKNQRNRAREAEVSNRELLAMASIDAGQLCLQRGEPARAVEHFKNGLDRGGDDPAAIHLLLVEALVSNGNIDSAAEYLSSACQFDRPDLLPLVKYCLLYTSPSPRDRQKSRMPSSA